MPKITNPQDEMTHAAKSEALRSKKHQRGSRGERIAKSKSTVARKMAIKAAEERMPNAPQS